MPIIEAYRSGSPEEEEAAAEAETGHISVDRDIVITSAILESPSVIRAETRAAQTGKGRWLAEITT
jgi:hypothetical protein